MSEKPSPSNENQMNEDQLISEQLQQIKHKILILSGKGGVGKSTVAANLAVATALAGHSVGLLDIDVHGPSIPKLLHLENNPLKIENNKIFPVTLSSQLKVMSIGFLLRNEQEAVIWRGPMKSAIIRQFIRDVVWGSLDYLFVDSPPGTGDEPLSVAQLLAPHAQAIIVTTPQEIALQDVRKCITFCRQVHISILGIIENMSGFKCPECGKRIDIFKAGGGKELAAQMDVPFLGSIPLDPMIVDSGDSGNPYSFHFAHSPTAQLFQQVIQPILNR